MISQMYFYLSYMPPNSIYLKNIRLSRLCLMPMHHYHSGPSVLARHSVKLCSYEAVDCWLSACTVYCVYHARMRWFPWEHVDFMISPFASPCEWDPRSHVFWGRCASSLVYWRVCNIRISSSRRDEVLYLMNAVVNNHEAMCFHL